MIKYCFVFMMLCVFLGCSSNPKLQNSISILDQELFRSYQDMDNSLAIKRSTLLFSEGKSADSCKSYYSLYPDYKLDESARNQQVKSEYLICDALRILLSSSGVSNEAVKPLNLGKHLLTKLDLRTFPSSINRSATEDSHTLYSLYPNEASFNDNVAEWQADEWVIAMEVVAVARINKNLKPDWIVWVSDESKLGSYKGYSTIIIYDPSGNDSLTAAAY
ncbi:MAG: hypothetical protein P8144_13855 [Gammaproteobacteria bacterium]